MLKLILDQPTATLHVDIEKRTLMCSFKGHIDFNEYKKVLLMAVDTVAEHKVHNIMMNRLEVEVLPPECRLWVKNEYLKTHIKPHIPNLNKVAVVESKSILGNLYGKAIYQMLSLIYPSLSFKFFNTVDAGMAWFDGKQVEVPQMEEPDLDEAYNESGELELLTLEKTSTTTETQRNKLLDKFLDYFFRTKK